MRYPRGGDGGFVAQPSITVKTENFFRVLQDRCSDNTHLPPVGDGRQMREGA